MQNVHFPAKSFSIIYLVICSVYQARAMQKNARFALFDGVLGDDGLHIAGHGT